MTDLGGSRLEVWAVSVLKALISVFGEDTAKKRMDRWILNVALDVMPMMHLMMG